jgi:GNAT superfamily N-acetyltransferase
MEDDVIIRRAASADTEALGRLGAELVRLHHHWDAARFLEPGRDTARGYGRFLASQAEGADSVVFVAVLEGCVIGYVYAALEPMSWMELRGEAGFVHDVVVDESARRRGIATRLLRQAIDWLEEKGSPRVILWSAARNTEAHPLFERLGFRRTMIEMTRERSATPVPPNSGSAPCAGGSSPRSAAT